MEELNEKNFEEKLKNKKAIVLFHAQWCPDCRAFKPVFIETEKELPETSFFLADVSDPENHLNKKFDIMKLPTIIYFENLIEKRRKGADHLTREDIKSVIKG